MTAGLPPQEPKALLGGHGLKFGATIRRTSKVEPISACEQILEDAFDGVVEGAGAVIVHVMLGSLFDWVWRRLYHSDGGVALFRTGRGRFRGIPDHVGP